jgi:hypothetical protein
MALATTDSRLDPGRLLLTASTTPGRALPGDDPALGLTPVPAPPVLLLEPAETFLAVDPSGTRRELQTEILVQQGFQRFGVDAGTVRGLAGWTLHCTPGGEVLLRDGAGEVWVRSDARVGRSWYTTAQAYGQVLVVYGALVGVRAPRGVPAAQYAPARRAAELHAGRLQGLVAAALVSVVG